MKAAAGDAARLQRELREWMDAFAVRHGRGKSAARRAPARAHV